MANSISSRPAESGRAAHAKAFLTADLRASGFDIVRVADPGQFCQRAGERLARALADGHHGDMHWLPRTAERRSHPQALWPEARAVVIAAQSTAPPEDPLANLSRTHTATIASYARGRDYHDVLKGRLKTAGQRLMARFGGEIKVFVDTAPVMEKPLAELAGLGWQGKHTNLVSQEHGSWLLLSALFTSLPLPADAPHPDRCGTCRRCLDVCPTDAFPAPYRLDARRCLSYLTIEAKRMIPREFRAAMGNRVFGCDDCLAICPWNKFAAVAREGKIAAPDHRPPALRDLAKLDEAGFRARFAGTPIKRTGRERFVRNVVIALANNGDPQDGGLIRTLCADEAPQVRAAAAWAAKRVLTPAAYATARRDRLARESDEDVRAEWDDTSIACQAGLPA